MKVFEQVLGFFKYTEINPHKGAESINKTLFMTKRWATLAVAIVSGVAAAVYGWELIGRYTDIVFLKALSGVFFFGVSTYITDIVLTDLIQQSSFDFLVFFNPETYKQTKRIEYVPEHGAKYDRFEENGKVFSIMPKYGWFQRVMQVVNWVLITALIGGLFWFDYTQVRVAVVPIANMAKQKETIDFSAKRDSLIEQENNRLASTDAAILEATRMINSLQSQINQTERNVQANNKNLDGMDKGKKNGWELQELARRKAAATATIREQLNTAINNKNLLIEQRVQAEAYKMAVVSRNDSLVMNKNAEIESSNKSLVIDTSSMLFWIGFGLKILIGLIEIILVVRFLASNPVDYNKDNEVNHKDVNHAAIAGFRPGI